MFDSKVFFYSNYGKYIRITCAVNYIKRINIFKTVRCESFFDNDFMQQTRNRISNYNSIKKQGIPLLSRFRLTREQYFMFGKSIMFLINPWKTFIPI